MNPVEPSKKINPALAALIVIVLITAITTAVMATKSKDSTSNDSTAKTTTTTDTSTESTASTDTNASAASYTDGTYGATGTYITPGGQESLELTVTIADGTITATSLKENARSGEAKEYQAKFASGYKSLVVGKKINSVSLSRVAGSSLTSTGFNEALDQIKTDAIQTAQ